MLTKSVRPATYTQKRRCTICQGANLVQALHLPHLPLTGIYTEGHANDGKYPLIDQAWMLCVDCGHGQLKHVVDQQYLYEDTYTHRGGLSPIASGGNDFFVQFLKKIVGNRRFKTIVDIGCSDLYLLRKLRDQADHLWGIDPIWIDKDHVTPEGIQVLGRYIENVDWKDIPHRPDLVVSAHTFEHVNEAGWEIARAVSAAEDGAIFVIEVPGTDSMIAAHRFDQIFHQHINYYSVASLKRLIQELGCTYLDHTFNYSFWSGTMLMAFVKQTPTDRSPMQDKQIAVEDAQSSFARFKNQVHELMETISRVQEPLWGYGAAQMAPILAYHMKSDLSFLEGILDDNPDRHGKNFPHLAPIIRMPGPHTTLENSAVLITALDSVRPIMRRVHAFKARRVLLPLQMY